MNTMNDNESISIKRIKVDNDDITNNNNNNNNNSDCVNNDNIIPTSSDNNNKIPNYSGRSPPTNPIFEIVYKSDDFCIVNKPYDVNIDDDGKGRAITVVKYLEDRYPELKGTVRFVNRIDYATSGLVVTALNKVAASKGMELFQNRDTTKTYLAIVHGHLELDEGLIDKPIAYDTLDSNSFKMCIGNNSDNKGRSSQTTYKVLERGYIYRSKQFYDAIINQQNQYQNENNNSSDDNSNNNNNKNDNSNNSNIDNNNNNNNNENNSNSNSNDEEVIKIPVTKVLLYPKTGRRHQLRVHLLSIGHVIVGDETYSIKDPLSHRMMLHSWKLILPFKNQQIIDVETQDPFNETLIK